MKRLSYVTLRINFFNRNLPTPSLMLIIFPWIFANLDNARCGNLESALFRSLKLPMIGHAIGPNQHINTFQYSFILLLNTKFSYLPGGRFPAMNLFQILQKATRDRNDTTYYQHFAYEIHSSAIIAPLESLRPISGTGLSIKLQSINKLTAKEVYCKVF